MSLIENIANNIKVLHKVKSVPTNTSKIGIHLVEGGGVYIVTKDPVNPALKVVKKIYESSDYYMKGSVDAMLSAQKQLLDDVDAILQSQINTHSSQISAINQKDAAQDTQIQNIITSYIDNKGYFASLSSLQTSYPSPQVGDTAYVANASSSTGYYIYNVVGGVWTASTVEAPPVSVPINDYAQHGYASSPKTLKEVDDELVQLEQEQIQGGVYDVSSHNNNAVFESLQALLSNANLSTLIPTSVRHGGMSIRFIQSIPNSNNMYVQFRCMADSFTTNITQWQGVDKEPVYGSKNLVESGGVYANSLYKFIKKNTTYDQRFFYSIKDIKVYSDRKLKKLYLSSQTIKPYSIATDVICTFAYIRDDDTYTGVSLLKSAVSPSLGVQRVVIEGIRDNIYIVLTMDFDYLEQIGEVYTNAEFQEQVYKNINSSYNFNYTYGLDIYSNVQPTNVEDTFSVGQVLYIKVAEGNNSLNLKTRKFISNYNSERITISYYSTKIGFIKLLKVDNDDWIIISSTLDSEHLCIEGITNTKIVINKKSTDIINLQHSEVYIKFNTGDLPDGQYGLFSGLSFTIAQYAVAASNRYNIYIVSGDSVSDTRIVEFGGAELLKKNTDYELYIKIYNNKIVFACLNGKQGTINDITISTASRVYTYIGSLVNSYYYTGIIKKVIITKDYVGLGNLRKNFVNDSNISLNLQPNNIVTRNAWLDLSNEQNHFYSEFALTISKTVSPINLISDNINKPNLFDKNMVWKDYIVDSNYGKPGYWDPETHEEVCSVAMIPAIHNKYYVINNPYGWNNMYIIGAGHLGVNYYGNNQSSDNYILKGGRYAIAKAVYSANVNAFVDCIYFNLYRTAKTVPNVDDVPFVEVYEMESLDEAVEFINNKWSDEKRLPKEINIDENILNSNVGTFSSAYKDKSILIFGDSISANHGWSNYIMNTLKIRNIYNVAIGGANIAGSMNGNGNPRHLIYQLATAASTLGGVCFLEGKNINGVYEKKIDCVLISMGFNDANNNRNNGSLEDIKNILWETFAPLDDNSDFTSIMAALKYCIFYLKTTKLTGSIVYNNIQYNTALDCTHAKIIFQTPIQAVNGYGEYGSINNRLLTLENTIKEFCNYYSIPIICGRTQCGITTEEEELYENGKYLSDGIHPNQDGYIKMGEMNTSGLLTNFI